MSEATIVAALLWAEQIKKGEVPYNEYIVALAEEVSRLTIENDALRVAGDLSDDDVDLAQRLAERDEKITGLRSELEQAKARIADLEARIFRMIELTKTGLTLLERP